MDIEIVYNNTLADSRNPDIYKKHISDSLNNKILVFLIFLSKIFNKIPEKNSNYQKFFDYIFNRIEIDLREVGYGDMSVNKKMKIIVTKFYSILIDFKNYSNLNVEQKLVILTKYFEKIEQKDDFIDLLNTYFAIDITQHNDS